MYKKKKNVDGHMSLEGEKNKQKNGKELKLTKQKTTRVIACYCWREVGHLFQSL